MASIGFMAAASSYSAVASSMRLFPNSRISPFAYSMRAIADSGLSLTAFWKC